jgi:hypothetical protein
MKSKTTFHAAWLARSRQTAILRRTSSARRLPLLLLLASALVLRFTSEASSQGTIEAQFYVIAPEKKPDGNFWDSATGGLVVGRIRGILPDIIICVHSASMRQVCAPACQDSRECMRTLRIQPAEPLNIDVYDVDIEQHDPMYKTTISNPAQCTPCRVGDGGGTYPVTVTLKQNVPLPGKKPPTYQPRQQLPVWNNITCTDRLASLITKYDKACRASQNSPDCLDGKGKQSRTASLVNEALLSPTPLISLEKLPLKERVEFLEELTMMPEMTPEAAQARNNLYKSKPDIYLVKEFIDAEIEKLQRIVVELKSMPKVGVQDVVDVTIKHLAGAPINIPVKLGKSRAKENKANFLAEHGYIEANSDFFDLALKQKMEVLFEEAIHAYQHILRTDYCEGRIRIQNDADAAYFLQARIFRLNWTRQGQEDGGDHAAYLRQPIEWHAQNTGRLLAREYFKK